MFWSRRRMYLSFLLPLLIIIELIVLSSIIDLFKLGMPLTALFRVIVLFAILLAAITGITIYLYQPGVFNKIASFAAGRFPQLFERVMTVSRKLLDQLVHWHVEFQQAATPQKWRMVKVPVCILLAAFLLLKFGPLFTPPKILTTFPGNRSTEAPLDSKIEIIFNQGVIKSIAEKSFTISPPIPGTFSWESNQKMIFTPKKAFERATNYKAGFSGVLLSSYYVPLMGSSTISFETLGNPKVILASPQNEALEDLSPITVIFDRPMIALTTATNSAIKQPAFTITPEINGAGRWLGTTAYQFRPSERFRRATTYKVAVPKKIASQDGGILENGYEWEFSSERPRIDAVSPSWDYGYASPTASVSAAFNQGIDPKSATGKFTVFDQNKNKIPGRIVVTGNQIGFYALTPLEREKEYRAVISNGIAGIEGPNGLETDYSWNFRVAAKPAVISSTPADGGKKIEEQYRAEVLFKTPMSEDSFENNVTINPAPESDPSISFYSYNNQNSLSIGTYFGRSKEYTITIGANVKDQYGVPLGKPYTFKFTTSPYNPSLSIYPFGTYFGAFNQDVVPRIVTQVVNAQKINYSLYKLKREDLLDLYRRRYGQQCGDGACMSWQKYDTSKLEKIRSWSETYEADLNTPVNVVTKATTADGNKLPSGFYFLDAGIPQGPHDNMVMIVSKSTMTVKKSNKQLFAWAVNQSSGDVISNMAIQLTDSYGTVLTQGDTNNDGVFMKNAELFEKNNLFVFGQKDDDVVVASSAWADGINRSDFGLPTYYNPSEQKDYRVEQNYKLFITLDRPIYRPGQKVYFKGVIRKDNDGAYQNLPPGEKVSVTINDAQNRSVYSQDLPITSYGSFAGTFTLGKDTNLGYYAIGSKYQGNTFSQQFQVEEYKRPDVAVTVSSSKDAYAQGENATIDINSSYYFGSPVAGAPVTWTLQTYDYSFQWDKDWRFEFGDPDSYWSMPWWSYSRHSYFSGQKVTEGSGKTDDKGNLEINLPLDISKHKTSQRMTVEAVVNDINNQSIAASREFIVHKAGLYAGIRPESYGNQSGKEARVEIATVDMKGNEVPGTPVAVEFYKRTWETIREKNPDDGQFYYTSKPSDTLVSSTTVTTDSLGRTKASFTPTEGGTYKIVSKVNDKNGNQNVSGSFIWVSGFGFSVARENNDRIVVVTDKRDYLVGENASVFVASPYASDSAKTLITAERGSVLDYKVVDTNNASNNFSLPIPALYTPNAFIGAVLVRGGNQIKKPAEFKIGYTEIKVTDKKQQVDVAITTDKKRYKPKETMKVAIVTKDKLGNPVPAELAVGLVDKAVWDMGSVDMSDIYKTFYQPRNLEVETAQLLTISIDRINANTDLGAKGGSGGGCFTGDTPILMEGSLQKNIQDVRVGDIVLTKENEASSRLVKARVTHVFKHTVDQYLILNGNLKVTPVHRMYVNGGWKVAGEIVTGDYLLDRNNQPVRVFSVEQVKGKFNVYNLETETYHTYFAGGIYVHNQKGGNDTTRTNFPETAYWNPTVTTDKNGTASLEIKLPDNLTTWRLAAIANSKEAAFGSSTSEVIVSRDVLIRPFLPRFLSVGDEAKLGAIVVNTSGRDQVFTAKIEGEGIRILDESTRQQAVADGAQVKLTWSTLTADTKTAKIRLSVTGTDKSAADAVETTLPVTSYSVPEVVAVAGEAKSTAQEKIVLPKDIDATQGQASISLSPSLGSASLNSLPYLIDYPYFCTEQTTSRLMPAVFVHRILTNAKIDKSGPADSKQLEQIINDGVQRLNNQQHSDGGWGWWVEYQSDPFLTAYAYFGLSEAKKDKFAVADQTLQKAQAYLVRQLALTNKNFSLNTEAYILYALRGHGLNLSAYADTLYQRRFELSMEARAYLAMSMKDMPGMEERAGRLKNELVSLAKKTATATHWEEPKRDYYFMGSNTTTTASILEMLVVFDRKNPLIAEVVRYLMSTRVDEHWPSTRDTAAVIKTISTQLLNAGDQQVNENYRLTLNGKILKEGRFTANDLLKLEQYAVAVSNFKPASENKLQVTKSGSGNLYYNLNLKYYLPFSEIKPLEQGMVVMREFVDAKGNVLPSNMLSENSELWVRITVVAPEERHYVIIEDRLPAGLEAVNESLKNSSVLSAQQPGMKDKGNRELYFEHKEYHDDRTTLFADYLSPGVYEVTYRVRATTPGRYHYPPAQAYQMYLPDVSGHSDGGWLEVK